MQQTGESETGNRIAPPARGTSDQDRTFLNSLAARHTGVPPRARRPTMPDLPMVGEIPLMPAPLTR